MKLEEEPFKDLKQVLDGVEDESDPESIEKLLMYLEELQMQDETYMKLLVDRVRVETITWEQPWYQRINSLTRPLIPSEEDTNPFRTDSFSKAENDRLAKNFKKFCKNYSLPNTPICLARWKNRTKSRNRSRSLEEQARHFAISYLARGLERNLYQVYTHFVAQYGVPQKGAYTDIEEKAMQICFLHKPEKAISYLSVLLGRSPTGISKKLRGYHEGKPVVEKKKWDITSATKLVQSLILHSGKDLKELKNARLDRSVWLKIEEDMNHPYQILQKFWYTSLHVQLFVKYDVKLSRLRKKILKLIMKSPSYEIYSDIRWKELLKEFPEGFTHLFLYKSIYKLIYKYEGYRNTSLHNVMDYAMNQLSSKLINSQKRLKTLRLNTEGNLEPIKYNVKLP